MRQNERSRDQMLRELDAAIEQRIARSEELDADGNPLIALPASDKYALAKQVGADLQVVEQRLTAICEMVPEPSGHAAVPRYRLRRTVASGRRSERRR